MIAEVDSYSFYIRNSLTTHADTQAITATINIIKEYFLILAIHSRSSIGSLLLDNWYIQLYVAAENLTLVYEISHA